MKLLFVLRMAWRDSRASRSRLALFALCIAIGVAALVATDAFSLNLSRAIEAQSRTLLGADLSVSARQRFSEETQRTLASLGGRRSETIEFSSMIVVPKAGGATRLVQVRGISGEFPFYGEFLTQPRSALAALRRGEGVVIEASLAAQYGIAPGDFVRLGEREFLLLGTLEKIAGEAAVFGALAPRVFVQLDQLAQTGLLERGSLVRYKSHVAFPDGVDVAVRLTPILPKLREQRLAVETVTTRKRDLGKTFDNLGSFLWLASLVSLLLGSVGAASVIQTHVRQKLASVATLRCLGVTSRDAFGIYLTQAAVLGLIGALCGGVLGVGLQAILPGLLSEFLPFEMPRVMEWSAFLRGVLLGAGICVLFAFLPLLQVSGVSPLFAVRAAQDVAPKQNRWSVFVVWSVIIAALVCLVFFQTGRWKMTFGFCGGLAVVLLLLASCGKTLAWTLRRWTPRSLPFVWRQGLGNLHRPGNRTVMLFVSLGLGVFLTTTLQLSRDSLLAQFSQADAGGRPNLALFDIQDDQRAEVISLMQQAGAPVRQEAPIVTMRLSELKGRRIEAVLKDEASRIPQWTLRREYRSSYRAALSETEEIVGGVWVPRVASADGAIPVSIEAEIASDLQLRVGDSFAVDVQGVELRCVVGSLRRVDWKRVQPNFFMVFPEGVLEEAPKFHLMVSRTASSEMSAKAQRMVVARFPNVSAIDLSVLLETFDGITKKISAALHFLALFSVGAAMVVLAGAALAGRFHRLRETALLRALGASREQVFRILLIEQSAIGVLGVATGLLLSTSAAAVLAKFVFQAPIVFPSALTLLVALGVSCIAVATGLLANRGASSHPPLEVLRRET